MLTNSVLDSMKQTNIEKTDAGYLKSIGRLREIDLSLPLSERLEIIGGRLGNPYAFISAEGIKVKVSYTGEKTIDEVLFEHFMKSFS